MAKLTATQEAFLKQLFGPAAGNLKAAAKASIDTEDYSNLMSEELIEAIKKRADNELALSSAKAVYILQKILDNPEGLLFADKLAKVASDILDRVGLSRQERPHSGTMAIGIVMLPNKAALPVPPRTEPITIENTPVAELMLDGIQTESTPERA